MTIIRYTAVLFVCTGCLTGNVAGARRERMPGIDIKRMVAEQVRADAAVQLGATPAQLLPDAIALEEVRQLPNGMRLLHATSSAFPHGPGYLLATGPTGMLRLGGFPSVEVSTLSKSVGGSVETAGRARDRARLLASAVEPYSNGRLVWPDDTSSDNEVTEQWRKQRPQSWITDQADCDAGHCTVHLTALVQHSVTGLSPRWVPTLYFFSFASDGSVRAWASARGEPLRD